MNTTTDQSEFLKSVEAAGFVIDLHAEQDDCQIRGNALAIGDDEQDKAAEDEIIARLDNGDVWAWASVRVTVSHPAWPEIEGVDHLGACSYRDEADFTTPDGYYPDMVSQALRQWHALASETLTDDAVKALGAAAEILK